MRLADRSLIPDESAAAAEQEPLTPAAPAKHPAGVSRWVNAHGRISLAGFAYTVGTTYAGEPVEVVVADGLVDILHAGVLGRPGPGSRLWPLAVVVMDL